jgi:hypothetical protein
MLLITKAKCMACCMDRFAAVMISMAPTHDLLSCWSWLYGPVQMYDFCCTTYCVGLRATKLLPFDLLLLLLPGLLSRPINHSL